ncbi:hypothetical protein Psi01_79030 [Planobispora siamensis]|uniref:Uncharacterized protein n=1 Tax=Planobispora siamensis TaxID=936338 RepID=A0A8J3SXD0_9ACTN|nr:hypothetical protein Psi01_79030 [Planobispora siamensis]
MNWTVRSKTVNDAVAVDAAVSSQETAIAAAPASTIKRSPSTIIVTSPRVFVSWGSAAPGAPDYS